MLKARTRFFGRGDKLPTFGRNFCSSVCMRLRFLPSILELIHLGLPSLQPISFPLPTRPRARDWMQTQATVHSTHSRSSNIATESPTFCNSVIFSITFPRPRGVGTKCELATYLRPVSIIGEVPFRELRL